MSFIVAIDGPAGSGKGTIASAVAKKFDLFYLDTGAMYRCVTLKFLEEKIDLDDKDSVKALLKSINIDFKKEDGEEKVFLDKKDVTKEIREKHVTENVSKISHLKEVRLSMVNLQRKICSKYDSVLDGRDIGTNVFPDADIKIYLDASIDERIRRRIAQNKEKGIEMSEDEIRNSIISRDNNDKTSEIAPLKQAEDAIYVDTTNYSTKKNINRVCLIVKKARKKYERIQSGYVMTKETTLKRIRRSIIKHFLSAVYHIVYRIRKNGVENIEGDEGIVICANHLNFIDAAGIVLLNKRYIRFVAKHDLYRFRIINYLGHLFNIIPVKRDSSDVKSLKLCLKSLKSGEALGIFPEGTRKGMEKNVDVKNGAAFLAYKAKVKVVPVGIKGTFKPFTKVEFNFGKPVDVKEFKTNDPNWLDRATNEIMNQIVELSK
ncbi:MAG: (d)CMP kinase [Clostridia bacterium]|nr:(d)CMP kinase [Clostridia bacterium]